MKRIELLIFSALILGTLLNGGCSSIEEPIDEQQEEPQEEEDPPTESVLGQIKSMGFTQPIVDMPDVTYRHHLKPKLKLVDDTLFVCAYTGIYKKNLRDNTDWELYSNSA